MNDKIKYVESMLYDYTNVSKVKAMIAQIEDSDILYVYAYNYNWDDGFEIPQAILDNGKCDLSIALLIFYAADGVRYLSDKSDNSGLSRWYSFVKNLYKDILKGKYQKGEIEFKIPLSKVQIYKLGKVLSAQERIFVENIEGKNLDINV